MANDYLFTSESVSEGHPDKVADQISDVVLDAILAEDDRGRVACETLVKTGVVIVAGEITTSAWVDVEALVRKTVLDIGYNSSELGFDGATCGVLNLIGKQSPDIAQGVDRKDERRQGAGDQGLMFGYATNETDGRMPAPIPLAHRLVKKQAQWRKAGKLPWLRPRGRGRVLRQGPLQGRPVGGVRRGLCRQEHRGGGTRRALRGAGVLRHRRPRADLDHGGDLRHEPPVARAPDRAHPQALRPDTLRSARDARSPASDLPEDRRLRTLRPHRAGVHLGAHRSRRDAGRGGQGRARGLSPRV